VKETEGQPPESVGRGVVKVSACSERAILLPGIIKLVQLGATQREHKGPAEAEKKPREYFKKKGEDRNLVELFSGHKREGEEETAFVRRGSGPEARLSGTTKHECWGQ